MCAVKYGWMLGATGLFLVQYKRVSEKYNPFYGSLYNNTNWRNNGSHGLVYEWNDKRRAVCPDSHCSANMVYHSNFFQLLIKNFMWHIQGRKNYYSRLRHQQIIRNEKMMQTSKAFKDLAIKIQNMSGIEEDDQGLMDAAVEFDNQ